MQLIDTHCHIHDKDTYDFALSRQQISKKALEKNPKIPHLSEDFLPTKIIERAKKMHVEKMITVGTTIEDSKNAKQFSERYKDGIFWSFGIHPEEADEKDIDLSKTMALEDSRLVAIGEVGLDYHNGSESRTAQIKLFEKMLELALKLDLPLIFHVREAFDDFFGIVDNAKIKRAVVHSFSDSEENLKKALSRDFYIGVNGLSTFANLPIPPMERTLLETDSPFLAPNPVRGRVDEPSYVYHVAEFLADFHKISLDEVADITTKNAKTLFTRLV